MDPDTSLDRAPRHADELARTLTARLPWPWKGLRPDLKIFRGAPDENQRPTWVLEDPVQGSFFQLGEVEAGLFVSLAAEPDLAAALRSWYRQCPLPPAPEDIARFLHMLQAQRLARVPPHAPAAAAAAPLWRRVLLGYLFFRIPLLRPDRLLGFLEPPLRVLWSPPLQWLYAALSLAGLVLVSQQMESYFHTANHLLTPGGAATFFACLGAVKLVHELGHGLAAKSQGLYVRRMGIAFMVLIPMLFTDTTDAWKLPSRRGRMRIDAAGILTEMVVAGLALFFWALLPDGRVRSLMFFLSGASLASTLLGNLNPLMRFDGYYLLMDAWGVSNLHTRAAAMWRHVLRRLLLGWRAAAPEPPALARRLAGFGLLCLVYRLTIYTGIALAVYHLVFPALGVVLLALQLVVMIIVPVVLEVRLWLANRRWWGAGLRPWLTLALVAAATGMVWAPFPQRVRLPALMLLEAAVDLETVGSGRLTGPLPPEGTTVAQGDVLAAIDNPELRHQARIQSLELDKLRAAVAATPSGGTEGGYRGWLQAEQARLAAGRRKVLKTLDRLSVRAPTDGRVVKVNDRLHTGAPLAEGTFLATLADPSRCQIRAYAPEPLSRKLRKATEPRARVVFHDLSNRSAPLTYRRHYAFPVQRFPNPALLDRHGGPVAARTAPDGTLRPLVAHYAMVFGWHGRPPRGLAHGSPCTVQIALASRSLYSRLLDRLWPLLTAEGLI